MREDIRKRREKYQKVTSPATALFGKKELLVARESGMSFALYSYARKLQTRALRRLLKKAPDPKISKLMIPSLPNKHLAEEVYKRLAVKHGYLEEVVPEEQQNTGLFNKLFQLFRNGIKSVPAAA